MKCFHLRCCVNNSFLVIHQGNQTLENNKTYRFHTVFSCFDPLMKHSNSVFPQWRKFPHWRKFCCKEEKIRREENWRKLIIFEEKRGFLTDLYLCKKFQTKNCRKKNCNDHTINRQKQLSNFPISQFPSRTQSVKPHIRLFNNHTCSGH